jgi:hypothetical protein
MKKIFLSAIFSLLGFNGFSQTLTFQAGTSISKLDWYIEIVDESIYGEYIINPTFLVGVEYFNKTHFYLSSNIGYIVKGGGSTRDIRAEDNSITKHYISAKYSYLTLNTTFDLKHTFGEKFTAYLSVGPRIDIGLGYNDQFESLHNDLNNIIYGMITGLGVKYKFGFGNLGIRYDRYFNFNQIAKWESAQFRVAGGIKDKTATLTLTYGIEL